MPRFAMPDTFSLDPAGYKTRLDELTPFTVGLEEEAFVLDPEGLDLLPRADEIVGRAGDPGQFKPELPAAQLEIATAPAATVEEAMAQLAQGRRALIEAAGGMARLAAVAVHPFAKPSGELSAAPQYERAHTEYGEVARRQLVAALQVHVAVGGADRTLAVYNALRSHLPKIAALAANGPFHDGRDTGLASMRPMIAAMLPRQGIPPAFESWEAYLGILERGRRSGTIPTPRFWWWELRPHAQHGTLEVRVPDAQATLDEAAAVAAVVQALVAHLARRHDAGEELSAEPRWRIEEDRWSAASRGVEGRMLHPESGQTVPTRERLHALLELIAPDAERLGSQPMLARAAEMVERNGAIRQREMAADADLPELVRRLADEYESEAQKNG